ncbi:hypothetical protein SERLA73DRAFT_129630 [Serpula lacrymans var. lacrymans S7.3]|uniref:Uncharacterized protein n=1 Tax=Serpula lacrymans var. lacrymans (strain S7.3) TaxID=936435 RepID=F8PIH9_SERL3|nr:hypothetical protein SERLA73DRAFT_129630 [Serpula lacrymans var. lacrymans S7.3]
MSVNSPRDVVPHQERDLTVEIVAPSKIGSPEYVATYLRSIFPRLVVKYCRDHSGTRSPEERAIEAINWETVLLRINGTLPPNSRRFPRKPLFDQPSDEDLPYGPLVVDQRQHLAVDGLV